MNKICALVFKEGRKNPPGFQNEKLLIIFEHT